MSSVFKKLNLKDQPEIVVLNAPDSFNYELSMLNEVTVHKDLNSINSIEFALAFAMRLAQVNQFAALLLPRMEGDVILWFAYPKGTSKKYKCDFNRDTGWEILHKAGFDTVRSIAIDEDWTALRFRRVEFTKSK